jgi:hypothetical protein
MARIVAICNWYYWYGELIILCSVEFCVFAEIVPNVVKSREGWELYIVTGGVMVGILLGTDHKIYWVKHPFQFLYVTSARLPCAALSSNDCLNP